MCAYWFENSEIVEPQHFEYMHAAAAASESFDC